MSELPHKLGEEFEFDWWLNPQERQQEHLDRGGGGVQGAERQGRKTEEDAYLVVFGREFQSAGFKWLKKTLLQSDSEWLRRTEKPGTC